MAVNRSMDRASMLGSFLDGRITALARPENALAVG
jgi:hypothetical protein